MSQKQDKTARLIVALIGAAVLFFFFLFGFFIKTDDEATLYAALHPFTLLDAIGAALFVAGVLAITGILSLCFPGVDDAAELAKPEGKKGSLKIQLAVGLATLAGIVLMFV